MTADHNSQSLLQAPDPRVGEAVQALRVPVYPHSIVDSVAYRRNLDELQAQANAHPDDIDALIRLADLYALRPAGGVDGPWRMLKDMRPIYDAAAALRNLERAVALAPGHAELAARLHEARVEAAPPILMAALPKSGSVFLFHALTGKGGKRRISGVQAGAFPNLTVCGSGMIPFMAYRLATHTHVAPSRTNLIEIGPRFNLDRMLVHVRDPRQALVSWFYFMSAVIRDLDPSQALHYDVPEDYLSWPSERQLDWQIDHMLPGFVGWITGWLDAPREPWFKTRVLYTTFEDMVADTPRLVDRILDFYEIDRTGFVYPEKPRVHGDRNFRRGEVDEWRTVMSPAQIERATSAIPQRLFNRFGWPRS
jgi:hypothetical protein